MYCRNCGKQLDDKAEFCPGCGVKPLKGKKFCNNCGVETNENQEICIKCGVKFSSSSFSIDSLNTENDTLIIILCIFLPPFAVWLKTKNTGKVVINILLCFFLTWIGGIIHAFIVNKKQVLNKRKIKIIVFSIVGFFLILGLIAIILYSTGVIDKDYTSSKSSSLKYRPSISEGNLRFEAKYYIKKHLKDPGSYKGVKWGTLQKTDTGYKINHSYRAKNSFGALVMETKTIYFNLEGKVTFAH